MASAPKDTPAAGVLTDLTLNSGALGLEAAAVMRLRPRGQARGGPEAQVEWGRMVGEKLLAGVALPLLAVSGRLGVTAPTIASGALDHLRRKVQANHRRLSVSPTDGEFTATSSLGILP